jgi:hypothetical protein
MCVEPIVDGRARRSRLACSIKLVSSIPQARSTHVKKGGKLHIGGGTNAIFFSRSKVKVLLRACAPASHCAARAQLIMRASLIWRRSGVVGRGLPSRRKRRYLIVGVPLPRPLHKKVEHRGLANAHALSYRTTRRGTLYHNHFVALPA